MTNPWVQSETEAERRKKLDAALVQWQSAKDALETAKEAEMNLRKYCFQLAFTDAKEGMNSLELGSGYVLKGGKKLNYNLKAPVGYDGDAVDAVDEVAEKFGQISNEGKFIAERLFKFKVDLSVSEYRKLTEDAKHSAGAKVMLTELNKVLEISEGSPTLEIREPKVKKS